MVSIELHCIGFDHFYKSNKENNEPFHIFIVFWYALKLSGILHTQGEIHRHTERKRKRERDPKSLVTMKTSCIHIYTQYQHIISSTGFTDLFMAILHFWQNIKEQFKYKDKNRNGIERNRIHAMKWMANRTIPKEKTLKTKERTIPFCCVYALYCKF